MSRTWLFAVGLSLSALATVTMLGSLAAQPARAAADCRAVKFVGVRGSGDNEAGDFGVIASKLSGALARRAQSSRVGYGAYGLPYTAVGIDWSIAVSANTQYQLSKNEGRDELRAFIKQQVKDCTNQKLVLEGYSQGAHVVGDVLSKKVGGLTSKELARIKAVILIADPRFNSREAFVEGTYRLGRNGVLGARSPGDLDSAASRIKSWCRKDDLVCQGPGNSSEHAQTKYFNAYGEDIVDFIAAKLGWPKVQRPDEPVTPTPAPQGAPLVGDPFESSCQVAWPTAPVRTTTYIQMTMQCDRRYAGYLLTVVLYPDPSLKVTPSTGRMHVKGRIVDLAQSGYGYKVVVVQASSITLPR